VILNLNELPHQKVNIFLALKKATFRATHIIKSLLIEMSAY